MLIFALLPKNKKMEHLTQLQRYEIFSKLEAGFSKAQIAKWLCVDRSTIYRELRRNSNQKTGVYDPELADKKYRRRMSEKPKRKTFTEEMRSLAAELLMEQLSPEQIKGRCDLLGVPMVSHERLYQFVWEDKRKGGELHKHLRRHGRKYRKRGAAKDSRGIIKGRVGIEQRPAVVDEKKRFGDFEIDLVLGRNHKGALLTANDRATRLSLLTPLNGKSAEEVKDAAIKLFAPFKGLLKTITSDNGKEFALHKEIAGALGVDYYFAHPYHSWERGANENMNGLIRQYLPKGTSFEILEDNCTRLIQSKLNNRPRKILGFLTPIEYFFRNFAKSNFENNHSVAFIT